jgi:lanosterol synthase
VSEALKAVIMLQKTPGIPQRLEDQRIYDAVDTILTFQNPTGGVASYERTRGPAWLELLNAAEVFENIMIEYDYTECTTATVTALCVFRSHWPDYRAADVNTFIDRAVAWIKTQQYPDGSWYGNWGICFTYGTMFALEALATIGETYSTSASAKRACQFLLSKQREEGGWSESYEVRLQRPFTRIFHHCSFLIFNTSHANNTHTSNTPQARR